MHVAVFSLHTALLLTHDKARNVFENCSDQFRLCIGLNIPDDKRKNALIATEFFMQSKEQMKVKRMIFYLDYNGDTELADTVMEYAEPDSFSTDVNIKMIFVDLVGQRCHITVNPPSLIPANISVFCFPSDPSMTPHNIIPVFQALIGDWDWIGDYTIVPDARAQLFLDKFSCRDQLTEAAGSTLRSITLVPLGSGYQSVSIEMEKLRPCKELSVTYRL